MCDALVRNAEGRYERNDSGVWRIAFELWPTAHRFAASHRIRLQVSSGAHPRNPGTGEDPLIAATLQPVEVDVLYGPEHPSALILPMRDLHSRVMSVLRGFGPSRTTGPLRLSGTESYEQERRLARSGTLGTGTLACRRCDAPVSLGPFPHSLSDELACPFCGHHTALREFLSLDSPPRPARVVIRVAVRTDAG